MKTERALHPKDDLISGEYNRNGYTVLTAYGEEPYHAGNHRQDSTAHESDPAFALSLAELRRACIRCCREIAAERGAEFCGAERVPE